MKQIQTQQQHHSMLLMSALKIREELLGRGWPNQPVSSIFHPLVEGFTIFKHTHQQPFVIIRSVTNPTDKVTIPMSPSLGVNYLIDFVFHESIISHNGSWLQMFSARKKISVVSMVWFQFRSVVGVSIIIIKGVRR